MSKTTLAAGTSPFAHLLAGAAALGSRALGRRGTAGEDEKPGNDAEDEEDKTNAEDEKPGEEAEDEKPGADDEEKPKGRRARRAKAEDDGDDADDEAEAKAADDDDDEEMAQARREGFLAAQARGRKIFKAASAGLRPDMAAHLAFNEDRSSVDAIGMLNMAATGNLPSAESGSRLGRRMARVVIPNPGSGDGSGAGAKEPSFGELAKAAAVKAGII